MVTMEALLEVAEANPAPVKVTQEEVAEEDGYITRISGALASASASTPNCGYWFCFYLEEGKAVFYIDTRVMADFLVDLASITSSEASPDMAWAAFEQFLP